MILTRKVFERNLRNNVNILNEPNLPNEWVNGWSGKASDDEIHLSRLYVQVCEDTSKALERAVKRMAQNLGAVIELEDVKIFRINPDRVGWSCKYKYYEET